MLSADDLLLQYPILFFQNLSPITKFFMRFAHVTYWVVDINSIRFPEGNLNYDLDWIKRAKRLILPSYQMWDFLKEHGLSDNKYDIIIHNLQDYLTNSVNTNIHEKNGPICFAGNLEKSQFLHQPIMADIPLSFFLYGAPVKLPSHHNYFYKGKFLPEDISSIEGGWGLIWDGDSCETCSGYLGQYLKYNASHKISLYIVSSIPVIIWSQSSVSHYILSHNLGIAVDSLLDIPKCIAEISEEEYACMVDCVNEEAKLMRAGYHIGSAIQGTKNA